MSLDKVNAANKRLRSLYLTILMNIDNPIWGLIFYLRLIAKDLVL